MSFRDYKGEAHNSLRKQPQHAVRGVRLETKKSNRAELNGKAGEEKRPRVHERGGREWNRRFIFSNPRRSRHVLSRTREGKEELIK